jgi:hypothetical protein
MVIKLVISKMLDSMRIPSFPSLQSSNPGQIFFELIHKALQLPALILKAMETGLGLIFLICHADIRPIAVVCMPNIIYSPFLIDIDCVS